VVLLGTHSAIVRAKSSGFFELMLAQPVKRSTWFWGLLLSRLLVLVGPLLVILAGCAVAAAFVEPEPELAGVAARSVLITAALVFAFVGLGLYFSSRARSIERAMVMALLAFVVTAVLHDMLLIAVLLRTAIPPEVVFLISALNPAEAARVGLLSSVDPELAALGPVGFWLANTLGPGLALAVAIGWPLAIGAAGSWRAARNLQTADLVA
jgi:ABC-type transport system involved in multi-copper enzyme maturation permease subunit